MTDPLHDHRYGRAINRAVSTTLRAGIIASAVLILTGVVIALISGHAPTPVTASDKVFLTLYHEGLTRRVLLDPLAWFYAGMIMLMLTPIIRVIIAIVSFVLVGDHAYTIVSVVVLIILCISVVVAFLQ